MTKIFKNNFAVKNFFSQNSVPKKVLQQAFLSKTYIVYRYIVDILYYLKSAHLYIINKELQSTIFEQQ